MEFNLDQRLNSENIELSRGNQTVVLRRTGHWDLGVVFSEQPVHAGQEFVVRVDTHNKDIRSVFNFVSVQK